MANPIKSSIRIVAPTGAKPPDLLADGRVVLIDDLDGTIVGRHLGPNAPAILYVDPKAGEPASLLERLATDRRPWTTVSLADAKPASPGDALRAAKEAAKVRKAAIAAKRR